MGKVRKGGVVGVKKGISSNGREKKGRVNGCKEMGGKRKCRVNRHKEMDKEKNEE